jgi:hypothetical protein
MYMLVVLGIAVAAGAAVVIWDRRPKSSCYYYPAGGGGPAGGWDGQMPPQQTSLSPSTAGQLGWGDEDDDWDDGPGCQPSGGGAWSGDYDEIGGGRPQLGR